VRGTGRHHRAAKLGKHRTQDAQQRQQKEKKIKTGGIGEKQSEGKTGFRRHEKVGSIGKVQKNNARPGSTGGGVGGGKKRTKPTPRQPIPRKGKRGTYIKRSKRGGGSAGRGNNRRGRGRNGPRGKHPMLKKPGSRQSLKREVGLVLRRVTKKKNDLIKGAF